MGKTIVLKIISIALMLIAPIISGMAFYEYYKVAFQQAKYSFPLGNWVQHIPLAYEKIHLYIGIATLVFAVLAYISLLVKSILRLLLILLILALVYVFTR